ncbi:MAG: universal stress protein [Cyanobacteria bacterium P01_F01_bin.150]
MFKKILVALNKSDISLQALEEAIALAQATNAQLKLVHVLDDRDPDQPAFPYPVDYQAYSAANVEILDQYQKDYQAFVDNSWKWLSWHANRATEFGIHTEYDQFKGNAGKHICATAKAWDADVIMIGSRCLTGLKELFWGSVSNYVAHHAACSVCVMHPQLLQKQESGQPTDQPTDQALTAKTALPVS